MINFEKISYKQFEKDYISIFGSDFAFDLKNTYDDIIKPNRSTSGSAGYDFYLPSDIEITANSCVVIPTGIRVKMPSNIALFILPRSGLGFKYRLQLANTVGLIDSDYFNSENEGHILIKLCLDGDRFDVISLKKQTRFIQAVFMNVYFTNDDLVYNKRNGGIGSTGI